jgi:hypothetical protein
MATNIAFTPQGNTVSLTADLAARSVQLTPANFALGSVSVFPSNVRVVNAGTASVWASFTPATATIVIPTAGTTTAGTPTQAIILLPGVVEVFTLPTGSVLWVNSISLSAAQVFHLLLGEGY